MPTKSMFYSIVIRMRYDIVIKICYDDNNQPHFMRSLASMKLYLTFGTISWSNDIDMCADSLYETSEEVK